MPAKLSTTINNIQKIPNNENAKIVIQFHQFMKNHDTSERHQNNNLKTIIAYSIFLGDKPIKQVNKKEEILLFLQTKVKSKEDDPEQKWITTYNDYQNRIKHFFRWLYNEYGKQDEDIISMKLWKNPLFITLLKPKETKRISPYSEREIWEKEEFLSIIKYEQHKRNKAALTLLWDLDARPHEVVNLKIKNIHLKERYGEGEIPFESKTGTGPILLTTSFPYVRDWLNEHPYKNEKSAYIICNLHTGAPIKADALLSVMNQLRERIRRLLKNNEITDSKEIQSLEYLLETKKWNPYCIRHSTITADSDYLPEYALKKKVRWSMNSKQSSRYIKTRMGNELKNKILEYNGINIENLKKQKPAVSTCPRCELTNILEDKYCSACSYPLSPAAYDEIKQNEEARFVELEKKYTDKITNIEKKLEKILTRVDVQQLM